MKLPETVTLNGMTMGSRDIATIYWNGTTVTGPAARLAAWLKVQEYKEAPEGSPKWEKDITKLWEEYYQVVALLNSRTDK